MPPQSRTSSDRPADSDGEPDRHEEFRRAHALAFAAPLAVGRRVVELDSGDGLGHTVMDGFTDYLGLDADTGAATRATPSDVRLLARGLPSRVVPRRPADLVVAVARALTGAELSETIARVDQLISDEGRLVVRLAGPLGGPMDRPPSVTVSIRELDERFQSVELWSQWVAAAVVARPAAGQGSPAARIAGSDDSPPGGRVDILAVCGPPSASGAVSTVLPEGAGTILTVDQQVAELERQVALLTERLAVSESARVAAADALASTSATLHAVVASNSWRATATLRRLGQRRQRDSS